MTIFRSFHCGQSEGASEVSSITSPALLVCFPLEATKVILCALTGKAAFGVVGATLHSIFVLPFSQKSGVIAALSSNVCNTIHSQMHATEVLIIDEVSMLESRMLSHVNTRLKLIFGTTESFGGKSVTVFGDFNQLTAVGDNPVYKTDPTKREPTVGGIHAV